jgi:hypothetical protein
MFRALERLRDGLPPFQEQIPQQVPFLNSYRTLKTDSTKKHDTFVRPEHKTLSVPRYSVYSAHRETKEARASVVKAATENKAIYKNLIEPPLVIVGPPTYEKLPMLHFMPSILADGAIAKPVAMRPYTGPKESLKIRSADVLSQTLDLQTPVLYSFCPELTDRSPAPYPLTCLQVFFEQNGGKGTGSMYPTATNKAFYDSLRVWGDVRSYMAGLGAPELIGALPVRRWPRIHGVEILWFNLGTDTYLDRITEDKEGEILQLSTELASTIEYIACINIVPPTDMTCRLRMESGKLYMDGVKTIFNLKGGVANCIYGIWEDSLKTRFSLEYSVENGPFTVVPKQWLYLVKEPNAPIFSFEGYKAFFGETRPHMMLTHYKTKLVETESRFPTLLQLRTGHVSGFSTVQRNIRMDSWRSITCCFLSSKGQGILYSFGPLSVRQIGKHMDVVWSSATFEQQHTFQNVLALDSTTPYLVFVGMKSDIDIANCIVFAVASFSDWKSGRVTLDALGPQVVVFRTEGVPLYNRTDSAQLCIGNVSHSANAAVAWVRLFDYEMLSVDIERDVDDAWERV